MKIPIKATSSEIGLAIRMTPLIDVIFLLLIFFILTIRLEKPEGVLENILPESDTQGIAEKQKDWEIVKITDKAYTRGKAAQDILAGTGSLFLRGSFIVSEYAAPGNHDRD